MESQDEDDGNAASANESVEENGGSVAVETAAAVLDEPSVEEVATPTKRVQRARGRGRNTKL